MTEGYETGFGRPPKSTQWKKGKSGNPKGRPKKKQENIADYARILLEPVSARGADGKPVTLGSLEAAYVHLSKKALRGDNAALFQMIKYMLDIMSEGQKAEEERASDCADAKERFRKIAGWDKEDVTTA